MIQTRKTGSTISCLRPRTADRARLPVTMPRNSDSDMCRAGQSIASMQSDTGLDEHGRLHGVSDLSNDFADLRTSASNSWSFSAKERKRRWRILAQKRSQIRLRAALSAQRNKTDAADALGIAHIMRTGWFREAHIKTEDCYRIRLLLVQRRNLKRKFLDIENAIRHSLKVFGIRLGKVGRGSMEKAVREAVAGDAMTAGLMDCMLRARAALWEEYLILHKLVTQLAMRDELCRRFMAIPGVGPVTSLSFKSAIDDPARFRRSRNVAAYFGLTSRRWQSGSSIDVKGRISKAGDPDVRRALYEAASAMLTRFKGRDTIKSWGLKLAKTKCHAKARVAVARKLAIVMHAMWRDGTFYVGDPDRDAHEIDSVNASKLRRLSYARS